MKKFLLVFTTAAAFAFAPSIVSAQNETLDFKLVNQTGYDIKDVFIAPSDSDHWGDDVMEGDALKNGGNVDIEFHPKEKSKLWDMRVGWVGYDASNDVMWQDLDLSKINKLTIKYNEKTGKTSATFE